MEFGFIKFKVKASVTVQLAKYPVCRLTASYKRIIDMAPLKGLMVDDHEDRCTNKEK